MGTFDDIIRQAILPEQAPVPTPRPDTSHYTDAYGRPVANANDARVPYAEYSNNPWQSQYAGGRHLPETASDPNSGLPEGPQPYPMQGPPQPDPGMVVTILRALGIM